MTTAEQIRTIMAELEMAYPDATFVWRETVENRASAIRVWHGGLSDLPYEALLAAVRRWIATHPKLPHISDIRTVITEAVNPLPSEGEAWKDGLRWVRNGLVSAEGEVPFGVTVMKSISTNRRDLGQMELDDLKRDFGFAYRRLVEGERTERTATVGELRSIGDSGLRAIG